MKKSTFLTGLMMAVMLMVSANLFAQEKIPFTDGFEDGSLPAYWTTNGSGAPAVSTNQVYGGSYALAFNTDNYSSSSVELLLEATTDDPVLTFRYYFEDYMDRDLSVDIDTDGSWTNIWTDGVSYSDDEQWLYGEIDLSPYDTQSGTFKLKFTLNNDSWTNDNIYLDNIIVGGPRNPNPIQTSHNDRSGELTWDHGIDVSNYDVKLGEAGNMSTVESGTAVSGSSGSYSYSGLSYGKEYEWQIIYYKGDGTQIDGPVWSFHTTFGSQAGSEIDPFEISNTGDLITLSQNSGYWQDHYEQTGDITFNADPLLEDWNGNGSNGPSEGFSPIGNNNTNFTGSYDGQGYSISNLYINRPASDYVGLFGNVENENSTPLLNIHLQNIDIEGNHRVAGIVGCINYGNIEDCSVTGNNKITGNGPQVGGIAGFVFNDDIKNSMADVTVNSSGAQVGGLAGHMTNGDAENCSSSGTVSSDSYNVGGLLGGNGGSIKNCYSSANVSGSKNVGGLVGSFDWAFEISNSYSTGDVTRISSSTKNNIGALIGYNEDEIKNCYSTGSVIYEDANNPQDKGLVGEDNSGTYTDNFFDDGVSNQTSATGATPLTTSQMKDYNSFTDESNTWLDNAWDMTGTENNDADAEDYWDMDQEETVNNGYPILSWQAGADDLLEQSNPMTLVFNTNNSTGTTIELPLYGTVDVTVDWGDGSTDTYTSSGHKSHTYGSEGTYTVTIGGTLTQFGNEWSSYTGADKLTEVTSFGDIELTSLSGAFNEANNLSSVPATLPSSVNSLKLAFYGNGASSITNLDSWDVSLVTDMSYMFYGADAFNQDIGNWNVSSVTNMKGMFADASLFNQYIGNWDVSSVTNMRRMFDNADAFNQDISEKVINPGATDEYTAWDVSSVTNMQEMFNSADVFNQDIGNWDVSSVEIMYEMFYGTSDFNGDIGDWNVSSVTNMAYMFSRTGAFNQDIGNWDVSSVETMYSMFYKASSFNKYIGDWNVSSVRDMHYMFAEATSFNQNIGDWNVSSVTDMSYMFYNADAFNQDISEKVINEGTTDEYTAWDVSSVETMYSMFKGADAFNQNIGNWNVSSVLNMESMFEDATSFNQDIGGWNVSSVENMEHMFDAADNFDQNIGGWDISSATNISWMFLYNSLSTANYDALLTGWAAQSVQNGIDFHGGNSNYSCGSAKDARQSLIDDDNWTITDGGFEDVTDPVPDTETLDDVTAECEVASLTAPTATDNCAGSVTGTHDASLPITAQGTTVVTWTYDDGNGNTATQTQNVVIEDVTAPTVTCVDDQTVSADESNTYTVNGTEFDPIASDDNCGVASVLNSFNDTETLANAELPEGTTTIEWTVTDNAGNTTTCSFDVSVGTYTGINELSDSKMSIYPNPFSNELNIEIEGNSEKLNFEILDASGQVVFTGSLVKKTFVNTSRFAPGIYLIKIENGKSFEFRKIIKK